jgi:hypothetical protein
MPFPPTVFVIDEDPPLTAIANELVIFDGCGGFTRDQLRGFRASISQSPRYARSR